MGYRARSAIGSQWSIPLRLIDGRPMPPLPPTATSCVGGPNGQSYGYREWFGEVGEKFWPNLGAFFGLLVKVFLNPKKNLGVRLFHNVCCLVC